MATAQTNNSSNKNTNSKKSTSKGEVSQPKKRSNAEVQNSTAEEMSLLSDQLESLSGEVTEMRDHLKTLVTKNDIENVITSSLSKMIKDMEDRIMKELDKKLKEQTLVLNEKISSLEFENSQLKESLDNLKKLTESEIKTQKAEVDSAKNLAKEAMKKANYNEQYSRKNNIKIMGITGDNETLDDLQSKVQKVLKDQGVDVDSSEVQAIHRIPSHTSPKPVLIKLSNNDSKTRVMRKRKAFKMAGHRLVDDVTKLNAGLINRLNIHPQIQNAWFFNGAVFALTKTGRRQKFDIYDSIDEVLASNPT